MLKGPLKTPQREKLFFVELKEEIEREKGT